MFFLYGYGLFSNTHFTPLNMSFQYGATVNKKKSKKNPDNNIHLKNLAKLCRTCCNMMERKNTRYESKPTVLKIIFMLLLT